MTPRDVGRARFYEAERLVHHMFDRAGSNRTVQLAGTELTLPVEARFASVDSVRDHVARVLQLPGVRARFDRANRPVIVRERRGHRSAHYQYGSGGDPEIAIPSSSDGRWALRELVVLHEIAHHLDDPGGPAHGRTFAITLIDLVELVLGPEAGLVYRVVLSDSDVL
ncbi:TIGR04338 family metallohydrolase [Gordonia sp. HNM0687]|uniref:TIGR04338 family metallohydrolase n=1 Tax=Gordonia mangrovi TaxID=2665643 RepID=A0A6L7GL94_9ACTN|nr:TIGR04338 family metallohydrolase [Gordonia mangrovi]MXP20332.1 TIGR04338 family metallohydrolase [Gordonia mangrovi]UVF79067.1 TIGR04338 family metallohydrolase [Gordonia mangrovi]